MKSNKPEIILILALMLLVSGFMSLSTLAQSQGLDEAIDSGQNKDAGNKGSGQPDIDINTVYLDAVACNVSQTDDRVNIGIYEVAITDRSNQTTVYRIPGDNLQGRITGTGDTMNVSIENFSATRIKSDDVASINMSTDGCVFAHMKVNVLESTPEVTVFEIGEMNVIFPDGNAVTYVLTEPDMVTYDKNNNKITRETTPRMINEILSKLSESEAQPGNDMPGEPTPLLDLREKAMGGTRVEI